MREVHKLIAFVPQDDVLLPTLSVAETLWFSARLRLPASTPSHQLNEWVVRLIDLLGLTHVRRLARNSQGPDNPASAREPLPVPTPCARPRHRPVAHGMPHGLSAPPLRPTSDQGCAGGRRHAARAFWGSAQTGECGRRARGRPVAALPR
jgi:hypothetical protein